MQLYLKGDRCYTDKCAIERRHYPPGQHGQRRSKVSDYGLQLREKQKVKRIYGVLEKQFSSYFEKAERQKGVTGTNLLVFLERRLDNIVYRLGFANSRTQARQLVRHNYVMVNGAKVNLPSFLVKTGDVIQVTEKGRSLLPKGLKAVHGKFDSGACVRCVDLSGREFARGLVNYSAAELDQIKGVHSARIEGVLGYQLTDEVIHRNDLVLTGGPEA